jgi:hypothetical protein
MDKITRTHIIVLDISLLKEPIVTQLPTRLQEIFVVVLLFPQVLRILGGNHLDSPKSTAYLLTRARTGTNT